MNDSSSPIKCCDEPESKGLVKLSKEFWDLTLGPVILVQVAATIAFPRKYQYFTRYLVQDMEDYYRPFFESFMYEMETPEPDELTENAFVYVEFMVNKFDGNTWESYFMTKPLGTYGKFYGVLRK